MQGIHSLPVSNRLVEFFDVHVFIYLYNAGNYTSQLTCPSDSNTCLNHTQICDGVIDCPSDSFDEGGGSYGILCKFAIISVVY